MDSKTGEILLESCMIIVSLRLKAKFIRLQYNSAISKPFEVEFWAIMNTSKKFNCDKNENAKIHEKL